MTEEFSLEEVPTEKKKKKEKKKKLHLVADVGGCDLYGEWNTPLKIIRFKTYIYSSDQDGAANPNSEIQVRCDISLNRTPEPNRLIEPEWCTDEAREYRNKRIKQEIKYFSRTIVDIDKKTITLTESLFDGFQLVVDNTEEIINRVCGVLAGIKEKK